jgi:hypothetical protein
LRKEQRMTIAALVASMHMSHDMAHGGMDMEAMVRDMRTRFWINLVLLRGLAGARDEFHIAAIVQDLKTLAIRTPDRHSSEALREAGDFGPQPKSPPNVAQVIPRRRPL